MRRVYILNLNLNYLQKKKKNLSESHQIAHGIGIDAFSERIALKWLVEIEIARIYTISARIDLKF